MQDNLAYSPSLGYKGRMPKTAVKKTSKKSAPQFRSIALENARPDGAKMIREARLERFENRTKHRHYAIEFTAPEFTCICPMSGFPDFATLYVTYVPKDWCVELKSFKLYLNSFRDQGIFHEDVCNKLLDELVALLDPWHMSMVADFGVRGNIKTVVRAEHRHPKYAPSKN